MSEENKALARKFFRIFELGEPGMADEIVSVDYVNHDAPDPNIGLEGAKAGVTRFKVGFPDAQVKIAFQVAEGDKVVTRYTWSGTHLGEFVGIPATGKRVNWTVTTTFRIVDGKIRETWYNPDMWGLMKQLGVV
jgi:steroid delta-isomerase-like uncharacterized protein